MPRRRTWPSRTTCTTARCSIRRRWCFRRRWRSRRPCSARDASCSRPRWPATKSASASASFSAARTTRSSTPPAPPARWPRPRRWAICCGLTPEQMTHAFGSAGTQSAGLWEFLREAADSKQLHTAHAAAAGLGAAYLAADGFTGASRILEGERGMAAGMSSDADPARLTDRLGTRWATAETSFKFHASCRHTHPAADALLRLMREQRLDGVRHRRRHRAGAPGRDRRAGAGDRSADGAPVQVLDGHRAGDGGAARPRRTGRVRRPLSRSGHARLSRPRADGARPRGRRRLPGALDRQGQRRHARRPRA